MVSWIPKRDGIVRKSSYCKYVWSVRSVPINVRMLVYKMQVRLRELLWSILMKHVISSLMYSVWWFKVKVVQSMLKAWSLHCLVNFKESFVTALGTQDVVSIYICMWHTTQTDTMYGSLTKMWYPYICMWHKTHPLPCLKS